MDSGISMPIGGFILTFPLLMYTVASPCNIFLMSIFHVHRGGDDDVGGNPEIGNHTA